MTPGLPIWDLRTGEKYTYCGPGSKGTLVVKNERGVRQVGRKWLSRGPRTGDRHWSYVKGKL